jgi:enterochelin esterase-like enzyme
MASRFLLTIFIALYSVSAVGAQGSLESLTIAGRRVSVYTPAAYANSKTTPYDLIVFFDGDAYVEELDVVNVLDSLKRPAVAVLVDNSANRLGDLANHQKFADYMATELIPAIRTRFHVTHDPARTVLAGWSAGGLGAAYVAFRHPEVFGNVLSQSGAFWRGNEGASTPGEWLTEQFRRSPRLPLRFYIEVGAGETHNAANGVVFIDANRRLRDVLRAKGYTVQYVEVPGAKHEPGHWKAALPLGIAYLSGP